MLYIMNRQDRSFETLVYGDPNQPSSCDFMDLMDTNKCMWHWRPLPLQPIVVNDDYTGIGGGSIFP